MRRPGQPWPAFNSSARSTDEAPRFLSKSIQRRLEIELGRRFPTVRRQKHRPRERLAISTAPRRGQSWRFHRPIRRVASFAVAIVQVCLLYSLRRRAGRGNRSIHEFHSVMPLRRKILSSSCHSLTKLPFAQHSLAIREGEKNWRPPGFPSTSRLGYSPRERMAVVGSSQGPAKIAPSPERLADLRRQPNMFVVVW